MSNPPQQQRKTYTCFVCQKAGFEVPVVLGGKDQNGKTIYLEPDGVTKHYHKGANTKIQTQQPQFKVPEQPVDGRTMATYDVADALNKINQQLETLPTLLETQKIINKLELLARFYGDLLDHERETSRKLNAISKVLLTEQALADAEAHYDQEKEDGTLNV